MRRHIKSLIVIIFSLVILSELAYIIRFNIVGGYGAGASDTDQSELPSAESLQQSWVASNGKVIVIDPGHGKASTLMSSDEKEESGWIKNSSGGWGDWRHYKTGLYTVNCEGSGCNGRVTPNGSCWYPIGNSDRNTEPDINLKNALAAKKYLEQMGYKVRLTRMTNDENPSITRRLSYCHPDNDTTKQPDSVAFVSLHSNASGGSARGSAYISAKDPYDQAWINADYTEKSNTLGQMCNDNIVSMTSLSEHGNGVIDWKPQLVAFCKAPVPCACLEIGFFDNDSDLSILNSEYDTIGLAIAKGVDEFCKLQ